MIEKEKECKGRKEENIAKKRKRNKRWEERKITR